MTGDTGSTISQIRVMQQKERTEPYRCTDYLSHRTDLGPDGRQALCNWGFQTTAAFNGVGRMPAVRAISYFDRFMRIFVGCRELALENIQLAFIASLVIALKFDAGFKVELDFIASVVTRGAYEEQEITTMEMMILQALDWRLSGPAPHDFIDIFLEVMPGLETDHHDFVNYLSKAIADVAVTRRSAVFQYPSEIAFGAICCALEYLNSICAIDSRAIRHSLQDVSGINCNSSSQKSIIESMFHIMLEIPLDDLLSRFARPIETDIISASSEDSPTSIFRVV